MRAVGARSVGGAAQHATLALPQQLIADTRAVLMRDAWDTHVFIIGLCHQIEVSQPGVTSAWTFEVTLLGPGR